MKINQPLDIILVEDDMSDAELAIRALKKNKLVNGIVHLRDGEEALDYLFIEGKYKNKATDTHPELILLDLKMPGMSGIDVLRKLKNDVRTRQIPVVVLTSSKENPDVAACYSIGVNSYIVKPVEFENFTVAVAEIGFYWLLVNYSL